MRQKKKQREKRGPLPLTELLPLYPLCGVFSRWLTSCLVSLAAPFAAHISNDPCLQPLQDWSPRGCFYKDRFAGVLPHRRIGSGSPSVVINIVRVYGSTSRREAFNIAPHHIDMCLSGPLKNIAAPYMGDKDGLEALFVRAVGFKHTSGCLAKEPSALFFYSTPVVCAPNIVSGS